jgi:hypothetical protein
MATRKQRRRRQKELRHEYEYVYVDGEGHELEVDEAEPDRAPKRDARRNGKGDPARAKSAAKRPIRKIDPPSWNRVVKRAAIFAPVIFVAFSVLNHQSLVTKIALTAAYTAFFIPFMYLMDRAMYRAYLRRTGNPPPARTPRRR